MELRDAGYSYGATRVLANVSAKFPAAALTAIVGPNGSGKSTLLGICAGLRPTYEGHCSYKEREVRGWNRREFSREVAFVPQSLQMEFPFTAEQVVLMGRAPYGDGLFETEEDLEVAEVSMKLTDCLDFRHRDFRALSGGERQRVILASALAQKPRVLLLDEPTTFLDLKHQLLIYSLLRNLREDGMRVVTVTHDLNLAATFADHVLVLHQGRQWSYGPTKEVLTPDMIQQVFEVPCAMRGGWITYGQHA
ncbi:MAG TPA: ABC transporter ATP-binding protein [Bryobacteraceae bacterium]|nr:ABC transporter ATP-binding protein [Bryobacteraceae bacterium]